jgi:hypothetical protein
MIEKIELLRGGVEVGQEAMKEEETILETEIEIKIVIEEEIEELIETEIETETEKEGEEEEIEDLTEAEIEMIGAITTDVEASIKRGKITTLSRSSKAIEMVVSTQTMKDKMTR